MGHSSIPDPAPNYDAASLAAAWLAHSEAHEGAQLVERLARYAPEQGWPGILTVLMIPASSAYLEALSRPLRILLSQYGVRYIDQAEAEAAANPRFRECLAHMYPDPAFPIPEELWPRLSTAAGEPVRPVPPHVAALYTEMPDLAFLTSWDPKPLDLQAAATLSAEELTIHAHAWVKYHQTAWADDELNRILTDGGPEAVWPFMLAVVERGNDRALAALGAGLLENLLQEYGEAIIERVESAAASDPRFRFCLGCVWPGDMPSTLWDRIVAVSGDRK